MKEKESVLVRRARACTTLTHRLSTLLSNDVHSTHNVCICMEQYFVSAYLSVSYDLFNGNKSLGLWNHHFYLSISVITHFFLLSSVEAVARAGISCATGETAFVFEENEEKG